MQITTYKLFHWCDGDENSEPQWVLTNTTELRCLIKVCTEIKDLKQLGGWQRFKICKQENGSTTTVEIPAQVDLEALGKTVRDAWVEWAKEQPNPSVSWLEDWETIKKTQPGQVEVDLQIALALLKSLQNLS